VYGNMLTGIQKPEELIHNMAFANRFEKEYGIKTETAMISDVPGANWGYVTALAQNEIKYVSMGPNHMPHMPDLGYQVGNTLKTWGDIPFYWKSPSGKEKVLCWMSRHGYSWFHPWLLGTLANSKGTAVLKFLGELEEEGYPYDMVQVRYTLGDNAGPDASLPDFVKNWNETHITPKFVIATNKEMFEAFEKKYAAFIPEFSGDFSPYWEDGTTSSAFETALNRNNSERLVQAQALWAMQKQGLYPKSVFEKAWRNVVLFSEHTWGSYSSKSDPDGQLALDQWAVKQRFALDADSLVDGLIGSIISPLQNGAKYVDLVNTLSWERTELVRLPDYWEGKQIEIHDQNDLAIEAQRLTSGEWAFVAKNIPPQSQLRYRIKVKEKVAANSESRAVTSAFGDQNLRMKIDQKSGLLTSLRYRDVPFNMIDSLDQYGWDGYWYTGINAQNAKKAKSPKWSMSDNGAVVQKYITSSDAPGAKSLMQEITYIPALDVIEIVNRVDKSKVLADENVRFSFPFNVPGSTIRMDQQWGMMQPGKDQLAGANQNFLCAQRWIDFSNEAGGLTWVSLDAPIVEFKEMHGQMWASDLKKRPWLDTFPHSTRLFSWVMDNVWFVNYKGYQEGKVNFRYLVKPHGKFDVAAANRFAIEAAQPLLVGTIAANAKIIPTYELEGDAAIITSSFKPADDGNGWVLRLWNCSDRSATSTVKWSGKSDLHRYYLSNAKEILIEPIDPKVELSAWETRTLRIVAK
ncbi:MAG: glycosyl hydrolase-related protein, partial [Saprospiraceae bacterium]